jgi:hypothetical protein
MCVHAHFITGEKMNKHKPTPSCPRGLSQFDCSVEDVDLVCFLDYSPAEKGSTDSLGAPYEPDLEESMTLNNAYIAGTDVDIAHMLLQSLVDHIEFSALEARHEQRQDLI